MFVKHWQVENTEAVCHNVGMRKVWRVSKKAFVALFGSTIVVFGIILLALPGPGLLVIIAGLAVLASEFAWAQSTLGHAKRHYDKAKDKVTTAAKNRMQASQDKVTKPAESAPSKSTKSKKTSKTKQPKA